MRSAAYAWQNVPPAPGRPVGSDPVPVKPGVQGMPGGNQPAPAPDLGISGLLPLLIVVPLVLFMFFNSRSQQKKAQKMIAELKKGDRVLTQGGLVGKLVELGDRYAKIEIAPGVKIDVVKSGVLGKDNLETAATVEKK